MDPIGFFKCTFLFGTFCCFSAQRCGSQTSIRHDAEFQATYIQDSEKTALHSATVPILHEKADKKEDGLFEGEDFCLFCPVFIFLVTFHEPSWLIDRDPYNGYYKPCVDGKNPLYTAGVPVFLENQGRLFFQNGR